MQVRQVFLYLFFPFLLQTAGIITVYGCPKASSVAAADRSFSLNSGPGHCDSGTKEQTPLPVCPFCKIFPGQKIKAWMRWNELSVQMDDDDEEEEES